MARIVGGGGRNPVKSVGRPGFKKLDKTGMRRMKQGVTGVVSARSVRSLFKRNPANRTAIIGTKKDVLGDANQKWNRTTAPNPTIIKKAKNSGGTADQGNDRRIELGALNNYSNMRTKKR